MLQCEFLKKSSTDPNTGKTSHDIPCNKVAGKYLCSGPLGAIKMQLCEFHKNFVIDKYHWKVTSL
jgi:hypothetical protein